MRMNKKILLIVFALSIFFGWLFWSLAAKTGENQNEAVEDENRYENSEVGFSIVRSEGFSVDGPKKDFEPEEKKLRGIVVEFLSGQGDFSVYIEPIGQGCILDICDAESIGHRVEEIRTNDIAWKKLGWYQTGDAGVASTPRYVYFTTNGDSRYLLISDSPSAETLIENAVKSFSFIGTPKIF